MDAPPPPPRVTLQLFSVPAVRLPRVLVHMALDRRRLAATPGLSFAKSLGTGDGRTFDVRDADVRTWGLLTVWTDDGARAAFLHSSPVIRAWQELADETWRIDLVPLRSRGAWAGRNPFAPGAREDGRPEGHVAAITRARLRPGRALRFRRAVPPVTATLHGSPGLLLSIGIGEAPVGLQGTFSVWRDREALAAFAYATPAHRRAIADTARVGWYAEELFARFAVEHIAGRLHGRDPLAREETPPVPEAGPEDAASH